MTLTGPQTKQIQDALLAAFGKEELARLVRFHLDETLSQIADGKNDTEIVFNLVQWADRHNRVLDLIDGAVVAVPGNKQLLALQIDALSWHLKPPEEGKPPYQGLQYFGVNDAGRFFGREKLTARLVGYLRDHRFLAVIGASGSGKSSVVRAGVAPALKKGEVLDDGTLPPKGSADWLVHIITPTVHPLKALSASLTADSESVTAQATLIEDMQKHAISLDPFNSRVLAASPAEHLLLVVDQFEELFTLCKDGDERRHFVDNLMAAAQPDGETTVIITLRADFYHRCAGYDELRDKPQNRFELENCSDYEIVMAFNTEFQGLANYYMLAEDVAKRLYPVRYAYMQSLVKTLAHKHKQRPKWIYRQYATKFETGMTGIEVSVPREEPRKPLVARFGAVPIRRDKTATIKDAKPATNYSGTELIQRLLANECELCGSHENIEVHHVRKLADIKKRYRGRRDPPAWALFMMSRNRKTVVVCRTCHHRITMGKYDGPKVAQDSLESEVLGN